MAFTEAERVQIRRWMGYPATYLITYPALENAITVVQSIADGGSRADNSTELAIRGYLTKLATLETKMEGLYCQFQVGGAEETSLDAPRGLMALRMEARRFVGHIADALDVQPLRDTLSSPQVLNVR